MKKKETYLEGRIRYEENYNGQGEYFIYELKWSDEDEWGLDIAFKLRDTEVDGVVYKGELVHYQAITKIREWKRCGVREIYFK